MVCDPAGQDGGRDSLMSSSKWDSEHLWPKEISGCVIGEITMNTLPDMSTISQSSQGIRRRSRTIWYLTAIRTRTVHANVYQYGTDCMY